MQVQGKPVIQSQTPDYHVHKHAVVSIKEIEQQLQQQQRSTAYPIDVMCSPYHVSQHMQRQYAAMQQQMQLQQQQQQQSGHDLQQIRCEPTSQQHKQVQTRVQNTPREVTPRTQLTYAQVATQHSAMQRETVKHQPRTAPLQVTVPEQQLHNQLDNRRSQQQFFQSSLNAIAPENLLYRQYQEHLRQQHQQQQQQQFTQSMLMQQHQEHNRKMLHNPQLLPRRDGHQMETNNYDLQSTHTRINRCYQDSNQIPNPTVRQLFLTARAQGMQGINNHTGQNHQQNMCAPNLQTSHNKTQSQTCGSQRLQQQQYYANVHPHQRLPWNNNNNSDLHLDPQQQSSIHFMQPPPTAQHQKQAVPSLLSLDVSFKPEATRVFQMAQPPNPNHIGHHHVQEIPVPRDQYNPVLHPPQDVRIYLGSSPTPGQFARPAYTAAPPSQQYFRDAAAVSQNTQAINYAAMR